MQSRCAQVNSTEQHLQMKGTELQLLVSSNADQTGGIAYIHKRGCSVTASCNCTQNETSEQYQTNCWLAKAVLDKAYSTHVGLGHLSVAVLQAFLL